MSVFVTEPLATVTLWKSNSPDALSQLTETEEEFTLPKWRVHNPAGPEKQWLQFYNGSFHNLGRNLIIFLQCVTRAFSSA